MEHPVEVVQLENLNAARRHGETTTHGRRGTTNRKSRYINIYVVVQFYPWFKFNFLCFGV